MRLNDYKIEISEEVDANQWDEFLEEKNPTQIYDYGKTCSGDNTIPIYVIIYQDGVKVFQWLMFLRKKFFLRLLYAVSEPYPVNIKYMSMSLAEVIKNFKPFRFDFYSITLSRFANCNFFKQEHFSQIYEYGTNIVDLKLNEDDLFMGIHSKHRNVIRRASRSGVVVKEYALTDYNVLKYYKLSEITYLRSKGRNISCYDLTRSCDVLGSNGNLRLFVAEYDGEWQAASLMLITHTMAIYWHGASIDKPMIGAANLLHWYTMKILKNEGVDKYDFGGIALNCEVGSKQEGITRFKTRFGGKIKHFFGGIKIYNYPINKGYEFYKKYLKGY